MQKVIIGLLIAIVAAICCGCTSGGYFQVGFIPVTEVKDVHTTVKHKPVIAKKVNDEAYDQPMVNINSYTNYRGVVYAFILSSYLVCKRLQTM